MIDAMYPILARYGSLFVYSYTVFMAFGIILGIILINRSTQHIDSPDWFDALLMILVAGLLAGRIGFVLWRWDYFQGRPAEAWQIWQGGLSYHTALLGGILALVGWAAVGKRSFYRYAALFAPAFVLVSVFGWTACWLEGCAYGQETVLGMLSADLPDDFGVYAIRYQTQLAGILLALLIFIFILWYQKDHPHSYVFWLALAMISMTHLLTSLLRGDPTLIMGHLRLDTLINALLVAISLLLLQYERIKGKQAEENS
jgi:phosphatidylglycerol:prolipoprotein diacylglycerol transferase